jgi:arginyl-tRNA synthetase
MKEKLEQLIIDALTTLGLPASKVEVTYPKEIGHGDYMSSIALSLAKQVGKNPKALAEEIAETVTRLKLSEVEKVEVAGPGFINFYLTDGYFKKVVSTVLEQENAFGNGETLSGKKIVLEYTQPNPFKPFHIGHLMSNAIGESLSRIFESQGASVIRANYQGDIGPHVAKAMYGIMKESAGKFSINLRIL